MKKIGILSFWNIPNYGAFMQAYALQKVLSSRYADYQVYQIPYLNKKHFDVYYSAINKNFRYKYLNPRFYLGLLKVNKRRKIVKRAKKFLDYYQMIPHENLDISNMELDVLVLGSDIIWDYQIAFWGNDFFLFGLGVNAKQKISYAPSFGTVTSGIDSPGYVREGLAELDSISVRDEKSRKLVKELSGRDASVVLDPTLIWNFSEEANVKKPDIDEPYVVVYGSTFTDELIRGAREFCGKHGFKLICLDSLDDQFEWCDYTISQDQLDPFQWIGFFKYAEAIMTCTYHGLMFGLIFKKKIIFNMTDFIMQKAESLLDRLGIKDVIVTRTSFESKMQWQWNYTQIDKRLYKLKEESLAFLDGALKDV